MSMTATMSGDFCEFSGADAIIVARALHLTITRKSRTDDTPMCGIPKYCYESYRRELATMGIVVMPMPRSSCMQVLKRVWISQWNPVTKQHEKIHRAITCDKVTEPGEELCPHHEMLIREAQGDADRKMQCARNGKDKKARLRDMLKDSPLFVPQTTQSGYQS